MSALVSSRGAEDPALQHQVRVGAGEVAQRLGRGDGVAAVAADERDRNRAFEALDDVVEAGVVRGPAGQGVLEDLVVGGGGAQGLARLAMSLTVRPRYSVSTAASADVEPGLDVVDDRGLALHLRAVGGCLRGHVVAPRGARAGRLASGARHKAARSPEVASPGGPRSLAELGPLPRVETGSLRRSVDGRKH